MAQNNVRKLSPSEELALLTKHVQNFDRDYLSKDRIPPKDVWRPHRFAMRDNILGLVVLRHNSRSRTSQDPDATGNNTLQVDVCFIDNPEFLEDFEGTKLMLLMLLSEAFMCGSTMEIEFTKNVNGGTVPPYIYDLAYVCGVKLKHAKEGRITAKESRQLYLTLTGFSAEMQLAIKSLALVSTVSPERVCYLVNNGVWTVEEMEILVLGSTFPEAALMGNTDWNTFLLFENTLLHARTAVLGGNLLRKLAHREVKDAAGRLIDVEESERDLTVVFDQKSHSLEVTCDEPVPIPWTDQKINLKPGEVGVFKLVARDCASTYTFRNGDISILKKALVSAAPKVKKKYFLLLTDDATLESAALTRYMKRVEDAGALVLVSPDTTAELDKDALKRLEKSEVTRQ